MKARSVKMLLQAEKLPVRRNKGSKKRACEGSVETTFPHTSALEAIKLWRWSTQVSIALTCLSVYEWYF